MLYHGNHVKIADALTHVGSWGKRWIFKGCQTYACILENFCQKKKRKQYIHDTDHLLWCDCKLENKHFIY